MLPLFLMINRMATRRRVNKCITPIRKKIVGEETSLKPSLQRCRTCLGTENLENIFSAKEDDEKRSNDFYLICGLDIKPNDGLPQKICNQCSETLDLALQFRKTSRKSEKSFINQSYGKTCFKADKSLKRKAKAEKLEQGLDFSYNEYDDENHMDDYYDCSGEVKTEEVQEKCYETKRKREIIPNALSYRCDTCDKDFHMKATYKAHMRFHTNYCVCESCGKRCRNNNQLQEHKRARHGLARIHKCAYCEYTPATKEALTIHERQHTGERPYVCDHCGATFHRRSNLVQHIAIHLPEKNFQCDMCPKRLKSRKFLQIHKHNAHTGKRYGYLCGVCGHRFEKPNKVRAHSRRVHGQLSDEQQGPIVRIQL